LYLGFDKVQSPYYVPPMAKTPEKKVKDAVVAVLKKHNVYYFFPTTGGFGRSGVPDIVCCVHGTFLALECKAAFSKTTALQDREIERIRLAGGLALVVNEHSLDLIDAMIRRLSSDRTDSFSPKDRT